MKVGEAAAGKGYQTEREIQRQEEGVKLVISGLLRPRIHMGKFKQRAGSD